MIGGGAVTGASLVLRFESPIGTTAAQQMSPLFELISPVLWGNSAMGSGSSDLTATISTPDGAARTVRVFAGVSSHAECGSGFVACATTDTGATVTKICVNAT